MHSWLTAEYAVRALAAVNPRKSVQNTLHRQQDTHNKPCHKVSNNHNSAV